MAHSPQSFSEFLMETHPGVPPKKLPLSDDMVTALQEALEDPSLRLALDVYGDDEITDPRAEGACLFDLSPGEWRYVRNAPLAGFLLVAGADGVVLPSERRALESAIEQGKRSSCESFRAVCRELSRKHDPLLESLATDTFERDQLTEAWSLVSDRLGADEAARFKACLMELGWQVAKASGGVLASWGWLRGPEKRALVELSRALSTAI